MSEIVIVSIISALSGIVGGCLGVFLTHKLSLRKSDLDKKIQAYRNALLHIENLKTALIEKNMGKTPDFSKIIDHFNICEVELALYGSRKFLNLYQKVYEKVYNFNTLTNQEYKNYINNLLFNLYNTARGDLKLQKIEIKNKYK